MFKNRSGQERGDPRIIPPLRHRPYDICFLIFLIWLVNETALREGCERLADVWQKATLETVGRQVIVTRVH